MAILYNQYIKYFVLVMFCVAGRFLPCFGQSFMLYKGTQVAAISTPTFQGSNNSRFLKMKITTSGNQNALSVSKFYFSIKGNTKNTDILNAKLFYTGNSGIETIPFSVSKDSVGAAIPKPGKSFNFNIKKPLKQGDNYFWLTFDIDDFSQAGDTVSVALDSLVIADTLRYPAAPHPVANRIVSSYATFCTQNINTPNSSQKKLIGITSVKIGNEINNASADLDKTTFYPTMRAIAYRQEKITIEIKAGKGYKEQIAAWADWNNDGLLDTSNEELFYTPGLIAGETYKSTFTIPCYATTGVHKIRIASDIYNTSRLLPCENIEYGDVEEYLIEVLDDETPQAKFTVDTPFFTGSEVFFTNTSKARGNITYEWDFNNNGVYEQVAENGKCTFSKQGKQKINLKLTQFRCDSTITKVFSAEVNVVFPTDSPDAEFIASTNKAAMGETVLLSDLSSNYPSRWQWEINPVATGSNSNYYYTDSTSQYSRYPKVIFTKSGSYTISLSASNALGSGSKETKKAYISVVESIDFCSPESTDTIKETAGLLYDDGGENGIYGNGKKCFIIINPPCAEEIQLTFNSFDVSAIDQSGFGGDYLRVYDGISTNGRALHDSAGFSSGFQNLSPGNTAFIPPSVTAFSGSMYIEWATDAAYIGDGFNANWISKIKKLPVPKALFSSVDTSYENHTVIFKNESEGENLSYFWDFDNDGNTDTTTEEAKFKYPTAGTYKIRLVVDNCGGRDTFYKSILILRPKAIPAADFVGEYTSYREGDVASFSDLSSNQPYSWRWIITSNKSPARYAFVAGTDENSQNPKIKFIDAALYNIRLEVSNSVGSNSLTKANYIVVTEQCQPVVHNKSIDIGISHVTLTNISKQDIIDQHSESGINTYTLFSENGPVLFETGATYSIKIKRPSDFIVMKGYVWLDYNNNGLFYDPKEEVLQVDSITGKEWSGKFTILGAINPGISRMRIGVTYQSSSIIACGDNFIGEFEDYTIALDKDRIKPVITLLGKKTDTTEEGSVYTDYGATAFDNVDGDISRKIKKTSTINTSIPGAYTIKYSLADTAGNIAEAIRNVIVIKDTTPPVLKLFGDDSIYVEVYNSYDDLGAYAYDNATSILTIIRSGTIDSSRFGDYYLTYTTKDNRGNLSTIKRKITIGDTTPPNIIFLKGDTLKVQLYNLYKDTNVIARDNYWKEVTLIRSGTVNTSKIGYYKIIYTSVDGNKNKRVRIRIVKVDDFIAPKLLIPSDTILINVYTPFRDPQVQMSDNYYPVSTLKLIRKGFYSVQQVGTYKLIYYAQDPSGNISQPKTVVIIVKDREAPEITLLGPLAITLKRWQKYTEPGYIISDNYDSALTIDITGNFKDAGLPGQYAIIYRAKDKSGNVSRYAIRFITVLESTSSIGDNFIENKAFKFFPNPANTFIYFNPHAKKNTYLQIYITDALGRNVLTVWQGKYNDGIITANVTSLQNGIYFINYVSGDNHISEKCIISR